MNNQQNGCGLLIALVFGAALLSSLAQSCSSTTTTYTPSTPDRSSFEHRYAKERVKLEGYSDSEAQQAADAIIRFHEAQKARNK